LKTFSDLGISPKLVKGLTELGIINPTEIQEQAIPVLLEKPTDFVGQAQTGTGKTAAYGLPMLELINASKNHVQALVLCPTRELAMQVSKQLFKFTKYSDKIFSETVYGGAQIDKQIKALQRPTHIIVATPGRLVDLMKKKVVDLTNLKKIWIPF
jgi:ATP-dependent RNA helicase DeaD